MSDKRRDNKGRILRTGESQRKNGMYEFRYTDANKKRRSIYDMDLMKLRKKEDEIKLMRHSAAGALYQPEMRCPLQYHHRLSICDGSCTERAFWSANHS